MQGKEGKNGKRAAPAAKAKKVDRNAGPARWNWLCCVSWIFAVECMECMLCMLLYNWSLNAFWEDIVGLGSLLGGPYLLLVTRPLLVRLQQLSILSGFAWNSFLKSCQKLCWRACIGRRRAHTCLYEWFFVSQIIFCVFLLLVRIDEMLYDSVHYNVLS